MALAKAAGVAAVLMAAAPAALADEADDAPLKLPGLTVEARQWKEDQAKVPGSVAVFSGESLGNPLSDDLAAISRAMPNVAIEQSSVQSRVVMRGISAANTGLQDPVGYFVDGVALPMGATQAPGFFGLEGVEVLKGPQSTLYGRNTEAGAIKATSRAPSWTPAAEAALSLGFKDGADGWAPDGVLDGWVSAPLTDTLAAGLALRLEDDRGAFYNRRDDADDGGDSRRAGLSAAFDLIASDDTDVSFNSTLMRNETGKQRMRYLTGTYATPRFTTNYNTDSWDDSTTAVQALRVTHRLDGLEVTAITGWSHYDRDFQMDVDSAPLATLPALYDHTDDALSQELRIATDDPSARLKWLGGLYTYREWTDIDYAIGTPRVRRKTSIDQTGVAGFGQVEYGLTERLRVSAGARLEWVGQSGDQTYASAALNSAYGEDLDVTVLLPRFTLSYDLTSASTLYASYARGYMPGGYNYAFASGADSFAYDPEYSWTAELGVKSRVLGERVGLGAAAFHTTIRDKQIVDVVVGGAQKYSNAAEAEVYGLELSADVRLAKGLTGFANFGVQHAEATDYKTATADYSGNRLPLAADYTWSAGLRYADGEGPFAQGSLNGSGPYYFDSANAVRQPAFATVDAEVGYDFGGARLSLWVVNLFDETLYSRGLTANLGAIVEDVSGREVGVRLSAKW